MAEHSMNTSINVRGAGPADLPRSHQLADWLLLKRSSKPSQYNQWRGQTEERKREQQKARGFLPPPTPQVALMGTQLPANQGCKGIQAVQ
jgi:hypothetical protein